MREEMPVTYYDAVKFLSRAYRHLLNRQFKHELYDANQIIIDAQTECVLEYMNANSK